MPMVALQQLSKMITLVAAAMKTDSLTADGAFLVALVSRMPQMMKNASASSDQIA